MRTASATSQDSNTIGSQANGCRGAFPLTHWSNVLAAGASTSAEADQALAEVCRVYWYPLYAFARRLGRSPVDAQDSTQGFFAHLIESRLVAKADPTRGRFRSFLMGAFKRFLGSERERAYAQKRGGAQMPLSLDAEDAEARFGRELVTELTPEAAFDRSWAVAAIDEALARLENEFIQAGRSALFARLAPYLQGEDSPPGYAAVAEALGTTPGTIKVTVCRMRKRYRELLRAVICETLDDPAEVEEELRHLRAVLQG